jgi:AbrB family looped-hinge helix DNA binding protein
MYITKIGRRGQVTLPKAIRRSANLKQGDRIAIIVHGERVIIQPLTQTLLEMRGSVPVSAPQDFASIRQEVIAEHAKKVAQDEQ